MNNNITYIPTLKDIEADTILENNKGQFDKMIVAGFDEDGNFLCASTTSNIGESLLICAKCQKFLLALLDDEE